MNSLKHMTEEILAEMDYQKLLPIQLSNIAGVMGKINRSNSKGNVKTVKRAYIELVQLVKSLKTTIDNLK